MGTRSKPAVGYKKGSNVLDYHHQSLALNTVISFMQGSVVVDKVVVDKSLSDW